VLHSLLIHHPSYCTLSWPVVPSRCIIHQPVVQAVIQGQAIPAIPSLYSRWFHLCSELITSLPSILLHTWSTSCAGGHTRSGNSSDFIHIIVALKLTLELLCWGYATLWTSRNIQHMPCGVQKISLLQGHPVDALHIYKSSTTSLYYQKRFKSQRNHPWSQQPVFHLKPLLHCQGHGCLPLPARREVGKQRGKL